MWQSKIFPVLMILLVAGTSVGFALEENFTLNFPQGNNTTTYITFETEQQEAGQNLIGLLAVAMVFLVVGFVVVRKIKGE